MRPKNPSQALLSWLQAALSAHRSGPPAGLHRGYPSGPPVAAVPVRVDDRLGFSDQRWVVMLVHRPGHEHTAVAVHDGIEVELPSVARNSVMSVRSFTPGRPARKLRSRWIADRWCALAQVGFVSPMSFQSGGGGVDVQLAHQGTPQALRGFRAPCFQGVGEATVAVRAPVGLEHRTEPLFERDVSGGFR